MRYHLPNMYLDGSIWLYKALKTRSINGYAFIKYKLFQNYFYQYILIILLNWYFSSLVIPKSYFGLYLKRKYLN